MKDILLVFVILIFVLAASGCSDPLTNNEIIVESEKCIEAGYEADRIVRLWDMRVYGIQCGSRIDEGADQ